MPIMRLAVLSASGRNRAQIHETKEGEMKKILPLIGTLLLGFILAAPEANAQDVPPGSCPMCGRNWDGMYAGAVSIPEKLSRPKNEKWTGHLREILSLEELSKAQYQIDSNTYQVSMPYMMVIPQEDNHIEWIKELLKAYQLPLEAKKLPIKKTSDIIGAYQYAVQLESDLVPRYEQLIQQAEDDTARQVLGTILLQTRMHYTMFSHALWMSGRGMGRGMMHWQ